MSNLCALAPGCSRSSVQTLLRRSGPHAVGDDGEVALRGAWARVRHHRRGLSGRAAEGEDVLRRYVLAQVALGLRLLDEAAHGLLHLLLHGHDVLVPHLLLRHRLEEAAGALAEV